MKHSRLLAGLAGLIVLGGITTSTSAMYHPTTGRFVQRDPGPGGALRIGVGGSAVADRLAPRDRPTPTAPAPRLDAQQPSLEGQYADGMNLYQYVGGSPTGWVDIDGEKRVNIVSTHTTPFDYTNWRLHGGDTYEIGTVRDETGGITSDPGVQLANILEKYQGCISELNLSGHGYGAGISTETGWRSGINQNLDPEVAKRIAKKLCKGAVVNICSCAAAKNDAKLQRLANKLQAKVCGCTGNVEGRCTCKGIWKCLEPNSQDDDVLKALESSRDKPQKK